MKDFERLMRGAHDGRKRKLPGDIYDQAATYGINDRARVEELYSRACDVAHLHFSSVSDVYRRILEEASGPRPVAPCKRTLTEALYGNPHRWAAPKPGVAPTKRTRTQTRREELDKRERFLKMRALVEEYRRQGIPLPNELRFKHYREVMGLTAGFKKRQDDDTDMEASASRVTSEKESEHTVEMGDNVTTELPSTIRPDVQPTDSTWTREKCAFDQLFDMMTGQIGGSESSDDIPTYNMSMAREADTAEAGHPWPTMNAFSAASAAETAHPLIQGKAIAQTSAGANSEEHIDIEATDSGEPLPDEVRAKMEALLGMDFSAVRIHVGPQAENIGARAFARGTDIFFAPGEYQPLTASGQELLAHELTHVVQQAQGRVLATTEIGGVKINDDTALERESDEMGNQATRRKDQEIRPIDVHRRRIKHDFPSPALKSLFPVAVRPDLYLTPEVKSSLQHDPDSSYPLSSIRGESTSATPGAIYPSASCMMRSLRENSGVIVQGSFISFALKAGAKKGTKAMLKNYIKTHIRSRIQKISLKRIRKQFSQEASAILDVLEDAWWETAIGFIPIVGDGFDLVNVPRKIAKAIERADKLEHKVKSFLKIQHVYVGKLIPGKFRHVKDYPIHLEQKTVLEILQGSGKDYSTMRKLLQEQSRLFQKSFGQ